MIRDLFDYISDIAEAMNEIKEFVDGMTYEDFIYDRKTINAVIRSLEVMGEAAKKIPENIRCLYSKIPWKRMAGMRDKLVHEYFGVDLEIVWTVATEELPPLRPPIEQMFEDFEKRDN